MNVPILKEKITIFHLNFRIADQKNRMHLMFTHLNKIVYVPYYVVTIIMGYKWYLSNNNKQKQNHEIW